MKMSRVRCLRCNEPVGDHTRSMQLVSDQSTEPNPGFKMNLHDCIMHGGPKTGPNQDGYSAQQGEGRFYRPQKQFQ
jgi:hypothetical protein